MQHYIDRGKKGFFFDLPSPFVNNNQKPFHVTTDVFSTFKVRFWFRMHQKPDLTPQLHEFLSLETKKDPQKKFHMFLNYNNADFIINSSMTAVQVNYQEPALGVNLFNWTLINLSVKLEGLSVKKLKFEYYLNYETTPKEIKYIDFGSYYDIDYLIFTLGSFNFTDPLVKR
jgi:hypothetical protein